MTQAEETEIRLKLEKALADADTAKRRAIMALRIAKDALRLSLGTPKARAMIREAEAELARD